MRQIGRRIGKKRLEILRSAAAAFHKRGYYGASVDAVAKAAGMTGPNLYYYFKDKEEILFTCHDYGLDLLLEMLRQVEASIEPSEEKLRKLIVGFVRVMIDELHGSILMLSVEGLSPRRLRAIVKKRDRFDRGIRRIIQAQMKEGKIGKTEPKLISFAILGAINWISRWYDPRGHANSEQIGAAFADYLCGFLIDRAPHREKVSNRAETPAGNCNHSARRGHGDDKESAGRSSRAKALRAASRG
jgi:TetR/AcrR family transcriptional regulator